MASSSADPPLHMSNPTDAAQYALNTKIMVAAVVVLFVVVFIIMGLHIYAKWFWRHPSSSSVALPRNFTWIRRRHVFTEDLRSSEAQGVGLDRSIIETLPIFTYKRLLQEKEAPVLDCVVCLSELQDGEKARTLPNCKHSFHTDCIDMWFQCHSTCPMCRTPILPSALRAQAASSDLTLNVHARTGPMTHQQAVQDEPSGVAVQVSSSSSPSASLQALLGSSSTRSLPQLAVEIPVCCQQAPNLAARRSASLSLLNQTASLESQVGTSSHPPLRSASLKMSIKRLLSRDRSSRGRRVFPSSSRGVLDEAVNQDFVMIIHSPV